MELREEVRRTSSGGFEVSLTYTGPARASEEEARKDARDALGAELGLDDARRKRPRKDARRDAADPVALLRAFLEQREHNFNESEGPPFVATLTVGGARHVRRLCEQPQR